MVDRQKTADQLNILLGPELTIQNADTVKATLVDALNHGKDVLFDLAAVSEIDSVGVQLLYYAKQAALEQGVTLQLQHHSPAVVEVFELYRLGPLFGDPMILHANERSGARS
jgi:anti-sigma B factor antagonist